MTKPPTEEIDRAWADYSAKHAAYHAEPTLERERAMLSAFYHWFAITAPEGEE